LTFLKLGLASVGLVGVHGIFENTGRQILVFFRMTVSFKLYSGLHCMLW